MNDLIMLLKLIGWIFLFIPVAVGAAVLIVGIWSIVIVLFEKFILDRFR